MNVISQVPASGGNDSVCMRGIPFASKGFPP
jgi:hypothetical protein